MIRFDVVAEPADFNHRVTVRGNDWLAAHPIGRPPAYWTEFNEHFSTGFRDLCAYSAMYLPNGTFDHFISCDEDRSRAYEWANYRYAANWFNSSKQGLHSTEVIDPYQVEDSWFEIILPSLQLVATNAVPDAMSAQAERMLNRMHLGHDVRVMKQRRKWYSLYLDRKISLDVLDQFAPLIAAAVRRSENP